MDARQGLAQGTAAMRAGEETCPMNPDESLLCETTDRLLRDHTDPRLIAAAERGTFPQTLWDAIEEAVLPRALVPEEAGGFGVDPAEAFAMLRVAAAHAAPVPLAETMLAAWLLAGAGLPIPDGPLTIAPVTRDAALSLTPQGGGWQLAGTAPRVPWGRDVGHVVVIVAGHVALVARGGWRTEPGANLAREPRDTLHFAATVPADAVAPGPVDAAALWRAGAVARSVQMAGAMTRILEMTTQYAMDRVQFGRPIAKFQAIQHNLAVLGAQQAAAGAAADGAAEAFADPARLLPVAIAKARTGEAAGIVAGLAHQIHGAIGFTYEHSLHFYTKRLWSWRNEFGSESHWNALIGRHMGAAGADRLWQEITAA
jgi:acyl-CoA dehydrogenase